MSDFWFNLSVLLITTLKSLNPKTWLVDVGILFLASPLAEILLLLVSPSPANDSEIIFNIMRVNDYIFEDEYVEYSVIVLMNYCPNGHLVDLARRHIDYVYTVCHALLTAAKKNFA